MEPLCFKCPCTVSGSWLVTNDGCFRFTDSVSSWLLINMNPSEVFLHKSGLEGGLMSSNPAAFGSNLSFQPYCWSCCPWRNPAGPASHDFDPNRSPWPSTGDYQWRHGQAHQFFSAHAALSWEVLLEVRLVFLLQSVSAASTWKTPGGDW